MTYINAVKYLMSLPNDGDSFNDSSSIERMRLACDSFEISPRNLKCIHIYGNEGKESCYSMLSSILENASYKVGHYFASSSNELKNCICCDKKSISHSDFAETITLIYRFYKAKFKEVLPHRHEIMTLASILYFQKESCDIVILEKSESRYDPTSITDAPVLSLITPFVERQAESNIFENIIHKGTAETVSSPQHKEVYNAISMACSISGCRLTIPIYSEMEIEKITLFKTFFKYRGIDYSVRSFSPSQTLNAITAIEAANALNRAGANITEENVIKGIAGAVVDEKCETLSLSPTIILFSGEKDKTDHFLAAIAQVKDQLSSNISIYINEGTDTSIPELTSALSVRGVNPQNIQIVPDISVHTNHAITNELKNLFRDLKSQYEFDFTTIFIGSKNFTSRIKDCMSDFLGS